MQQSPRPGPSTTVKKLLAVVWVGGLVIVGLVLLWLNDVISTGLLVAAFVAVTAVELLVVSRFKRSAVEQRGPTGPDASAGGVSTLDSDSPAAGYGYDPLPGPDQGPR